MAAYGYPPVRKGYSLRWSVYSVHSEFTIMYRLECQQCSKHCAAAGGPDAEGDAQTIDEVRMQRVRLQLKECLFLPALLPPWHFQCPTV